MSKYLIFAVDANNRKSAIKYCLKLLKRKNMVDDVYAVKVGILNIIDDGLSIIKEIKKKTGLSVICDLKLAEIPTIAVDIAKKVYLAGAQGIVVQGFVGKSVISAIKEGVPDLDIYVVSEMTHNDGGFTHSHLEDIVKMAMEQGVAGIIGPGNRPNRLRKMRKLLPSKYKIIAAGVSKRQHGDKKEALAAGADFIIEGSDIRALLDADDDKRDFIRTVMVYLLVGIILAVFLSIASKTANLNFMADKPILNVIVLFVLAIAGAVVAYLRRR